MGKNRICHGLLALILFGLIVSLMAVGVAAVSVDELSRGMTLQPGDEVTVDENGGEYSYVYNAGSYGAFKEELSGLLQPGDKHMLLTAKKAGLTVDDGWQFSGWYCVLSGDQLTVSAQYSAQPAVTLSDSAAAYGLQLSAQRMSTGGEVAVTVPVEYASYVIDVTVNGKAAEYAEGVWVFTMPEIDAVVDVVMAENLCYVLFDADGGEFANGQTVLGEHVQLYDGFALVDIPETPKKDNYIFDGWEGVGIEYVSVQQLRVSARPFQTVTLYAKWLPDPQTAVTLSFDACGGMTDSDNLLAIPGESIALPAAWRAGYSFLGWNTRADGGGEMYAPDEGFVPDGDITLYACWQAATCTVTVSVKHMDRTVSDISAIQLKDEYGRTIVGEDNGTGVYVFTNVPDGEYNLYISDRSRSGSCGGVTVRGGKVIAALLELEMWS